MPTDNIKTDLKQVGWYAVVHFGSEEKDTMPWFLKRIPYRRADNGELQTTYNHFTFNLKEAALFSNIFDAEQAKEAVKRELASRNHSLKDHVKIIQLLGRIREIKED